MILVHRAETDEGDVIPYHRTDLECGKELDGSDDRVCKLLGYFCLPSKYGIYIRIQSILSTHTYAYTAFDR